MHRIAYYFLRMNGCIVFVKLLQVIPECVMIDVPKVNQQDECKHDVRLETSSGLALMKK